MNHLNLKTKKKVILGSRNFSFVDEPLKNVILKKLLIIS